MTPSISVPLRTVRPTTFVLSDDAAASADFRYPMLGGSGYSMRITHVIRGDDHVNNTPRQINILRALGASPPNYGHLPTVLTPQGDKLSKRHGAKGVLQYRDDGYLAEALVNYLARLGWAHGDAEVFSVAEFVSWFDLTGLSPAPGRFDPEKLEWLNHEHLKRLDAQALATRLQPFLEYARIATAGGPPVARVAALLRDRASTLAAMADAARYFYEAPAVDAAMLDSQLTPQVRTALVELHAAFATLAWERAALGTAIKAAASRHAGPPRRAHVSGSGALRRRGLPHAQKADRRAWHVEQIDLSQVKRVDFEIISYLKEQHPDLYRSLRRAARNRNAGQGAAAFADLALPAGGDFAPATGSPAIPSGEARND